MNYDFENLKILTIYKAISTEEVNLLFLVQTIHLDP